ncbi:BMP family ABC transporter substrate-binding protein [Streptomyces sp. NPDC001848]|uniref:BMP family ABC transporter substrate-binding protein n=1 Tax=Streptomyces sp. NPDC001848 TaxID=3364618 RepID=UPI00368BF118
MAVVQRKVVVWGGIGVVVLAGAVAGGLLAAGGGGAAPRARQYSASDACLLTDSHGVTGAQAALVWAGMEDASLATRTKVTSLPVFGPATVANAVPYVNSLVQRRCDVVLAVGDTQTAAVEQVAPRNPKVRFVVVGGGRARRNVAVVSGSSGVRVAVAHVVRDATKM